MLSYFGHVQLFVNLWIIACQAPLPMGFSRQEYWNGFPCPPPGNLSNPEIKPTSLTTPILAEGVLYTSASWEALIKECCCCC